MLLTLAPRPLYAFHRETSDAALLDQQTGGILMLIVGGMTYLAGGLVLTARLLRGTTHSSRAAPRRGRGAMSRRLWWLACGAVFAALLGGFIIAWSGIVNVGASTGHWAVTRWVLHFAMRQSVDTHASGLHAPNLDDPALAMRGAGHYATGCAPCHGAPGQPQSPVMLAMTPPPPLLAQRIDKWDSEELFWIVRNGVKMTAMPAWVAYGRTDEVWAVVAFLEHLPDLDQAGYRRLAFGDDRETRRQLRPLGTGVAGPAALSPASLDEVFSADALGNCARCHERDGAGRGVGAFPILTGQSEPYLRASLRAYAEGTRLSGIMQPAAAGLSDDEIDALAKHYAAATTPVREAENTDPAQIALGREIAHAGVAAQGVPACAVCHGPTEGRRHPIYPDLAGQYARYIGEQLAAWKSGARGGTPFAHIMKTIAGRLDDAQIEAVSAYYQSLTPEDQGSLLDDR